MYVTVRERDAWRARLPHTVEALGACEREEFLPTSQNSRRNPSMNSYSTAQFHQRRNSLEARQVHTRRSTNGRRRYCGGEKGP